MSTNPSGSTETERDPGSHGSELGSSWQPTDEQKQEDLVREEFVLKHRLESENRAQSDTDAPYNWDDDNLFSSSASSVKKERNINRAQRVIGRLKRFRVNEKATLLNELHALDLSMHTTEICTAICDHIPYKPKEILEFMEVISTLHGNLRDFADAFVKTLTKTLNNYSSQILKSTIAHIHVLHKEQLPLLQLLGGATQTAAGLQSQESSNTGSLTTSNHNPKDDTGVASYVIANSVNDEAEESKRKNLLLLNSLHSQSNDAISAITKRRQLWRLLTEVILCGIVDISNVVVRLQSNPGDPPKEQATKKDSSTALISYIRGLCAKDSDLIKPILAHVNTMAHSYTNAIGTDPNIASFMVSPQACQCTAWVTMRIHQINNLALLHLIAKKVGVQLMARVPQKPHEPGAPGHFPFVRLRESFRVTVSENVRGFISGTVQTIASDLCKARLVMENVNLTLQVNKGKIPSDLILRYTTIKETIQRVIEQGVNVASILGFERPHEVVHEPNDEDITRITMAEAEADADDHDPVLLKWNDLYEQEFYETMPDLSTVLPSALLYGKGGKKIAEEDGSKSKHTDLEATEAEIEGAQPVLMTQPDDEDTTKSSALDSTAKDNNAFLMYTMELDKVIESTSFLEDSRELDRTTSVFFLRGLNNRTNRKRLVKHVLAIRKQDIHVIPAYCRFICTVDKYCSGAMANEIGQRVLQEFNDLVTEKNPSKHESKVKACHMISELTKFEMLAPGLTMNCLNRLLDDLTQSHTHMACYLINNCGQYLLFSPGTSTRFGSICDKLKRLSQGQGFHEEMQTMIQDSLFQLEQIKLGNRSNSAAHIYERTVLEMCPNQRLLQYLLTVVLLDNNVEGGNSRVGQENKALNGEITAGGGPCSYVLTHLLKMDWSGLNGDLLYGWLRDIIILRGGATGKQAITTNLYVPVYGLRNVSKLLKLWNQSKQYLWVVHQLEVDLLESIHQGCEINDFKSLPQRVRHVKLLGELLNHKVVKFSTIMDVLYYLIYFGDATGFEHASSPLQARRIMHKYGVVCPGDDLLEEFAIELRRDGVLPDFPTIMRDPCGQVIHVHISATTVKNKLKQYRPAPVVAAAPTHKFAKYQEQQRPDPISEPIPEDLHYGSVDTPDPIDGVRFPPYVHPESLIGVDLDKDDSRIKLCCALLEVMDPTSSIARTLKLNRFCLFLQRYIMIHKRRYGVPQMIRTLFDDLCHKLLPSKVSYGEADTDRSPGTAGSKGSVGKAEQRTPRMYRTIQHVDEAICVWQLNEAQTMKAVIMEMKESAQEITPQEEDEEELDITLEEHLSEEFGSYSDSDRSEEVDDGSISEDDYGYDDDDDRIGSHDSDDSASTSDSMCSFDRELTMITLESVEQARIMSVTGRVESRAIPSKLPTNYNFLKPTERGVKLNLLTRKGGTNKTKLLEIDVPSESKLVSAWEKKHELEDEEKQRLKQFVYDSLDRHMQEEYKEAQRDISSGVLLHSSSTGSGREGLTQISRGGGVIPVTGASGSRLGTDSTRGGANTQKSGTHYLGRGGRGRGR